MPILRPKDVRAMSSEDRRKKLTELRTELMRLKTMIKAGGTVENPTRMRELRRTIACVLTVETEQQKSPKESTEKERKKGSRKA